MICVLLLLKFIAKISFILKVLSCILLTFMTLKLTYHLVLSIIFIVLFLIFSQAYGNSSFNTNMMAYSVQQFFPVNTFFNY